MPSEYIYTVKQLIAGVDDSVDLVHPNNEGLDWRVYSSVQMLRASLVFFFFFLFNIVKIWVAIVRLWTGFANKRLCVLIVVYFCIEHMSERRKVEGSGV